MPKEAVLNCYTPSHRFYFYGAFRTEIKTEQTKVTLTQHPFLLRHHGFGYSYCSVSH